MAISELISELSRVPVIVWIIMGFQIIAPLSFSIYFYRELIRKKWYEIFNPEKIIHIIIHFPSNKIKEYWRLIPPTKEWVIGELLYFYKDNELLKPNEVLTSEKNIYVAEIDGQKYNLDVKNLERKRFVKYPQIHFYNGIPSPLSFDFKNKKVELSSHDLLKFQKNDLMKKLLSLEEEMNLLKLILLAVALCFVGIVLANLHLFEVI